VSGGVVGDELATTKLFECENKNRAVVIDSNLKSEKLRDLTVRKMRIPCSEVKGIPKILGKRSFASSSCQMKEFDFKEQP